jgi:hypothetical protein
VNVRKQMSTGDHLKQNLDEKQNPDKKIKFKSLKKSFDRRRSKTSKKSSKT